MSKHSNAKFVANVCASAKAEGITFQPLSGVRIMGVSVRDETLV